MVRKKMTNKRYILAVLVGVLLQGCIAKNLSDAEVMNKALSRCSSPEMAIIRIPSRGPLADTMMAQSLGTTHNDGGFFRQFVDLVSSGSKNIVVECPSQQKLEAIVIHALKGIKEAKLKGITLCLIGLTESKELVSQAERTGVTLRIQN
jgi:hypothetical protein